MLQNVHPCKIRVFYLLLERESESRFPSITFTDDQILKTLWALDINKAHGYNEIPIRMLKLCGKSIITPQSTLSQNSKDFPRHLEEVKYCACSQNGRQADSWYLNTTLLVTHYSKKIWRSYFQFNFWVSWRE